MIWGWEKPTSNNDFRASFSDRCSNECFTNWLSEIERFRSILTTALYYGSNGELDLEADITVTSYAILRNDKDILAQKIGLLWCWMRLKP